ncbi:MAG: hypothetical protein V4549_08340 [Bacteroidota bacterium]
MTKKLITKYLLKIFITAILFFPLIVGSQETPSKSVKDGWAIHLGAGFMFGGNIGILGEKQILLKEKLRISPFVASGIAEGGTDSTSHTYYWFGMTTGVNMEYGKKHRVIFGPQFVLQEVIGNSVEVKKNQLSSVSFIIGYKGTADFGLIWQVYIGDIYMQDYTTDSKLYSHRSHIGLGLGYKF